jgi:hypothetical protein
VLRSNSNIARKAGPHILAGFHSLAGSRRDAMRLVNSNSTE